MNEDANILIGTDEAGYGPNLGPLLITATCWQGATVLPADQLWNQFADVLSQHPERNDCRLHVADSKQVYSPSSGLARLELGTLAFLKAMNVPCSTLQELGVALAGDRFSDDDKEVRQGIVEETSLPFVAASADVEQQADKLRAAFAREGVRPIGVRSCIMFAPEFNTRVAAVNSKGKVLSHETLRLVRESVDAVSAKATSAGKPSGLVVCDKHGGRNRYDDLISTAFDDDFVFRQEESRQKSTYQLGELQFCFRTKAEEVLPVALASMISKYVRELVMNQFNRFWQFHLPDLKATKGYPMDARRYWEDIQNKAEELGIEKATIWRSR